MQDLRETYAQIEDLIDTFHFEQALSLCQSTLLTSPQDFHLLSLLGNIHLELGNLTDAYNAFLQCQSLNPTAYDILMNLGQLSYGKEALDFYQKGIDSLKSLQQSTPTANIDEYSYRLSSALCCIAELFLTDCCDEPNAEDSCEAAINEAYSVCPTNADVLVTLANLRLTQDRNQEATDALNQFYTSVVLRSSMQPEEIQQTASFETRLNAGRLMIEAGLPSEHVLDLLQKLELEQENVVDVHYLYALVYFQLHDYESCKSSLADAVRVLEEEAIEDEEMSCAIECLKREVGNVELQNGSGNEYNESESEGDDNGSEIESE